MFSKKALLITFLIWSFCGAVITIENQTGEPDKDICFFKVGHLIYGGECYITRLDGLTLDQIGGGTIRITGFRLQVRDEPKKLNGESVLPAHILENNGTYILSKRAGHYFLRRREWR